MQKLCFIIFKALKHKELFIRVHKEIIKFKFLTSVFYNINVCLCIIKKWNYKYNKSDGRFRNMYLYKEEKKNKVLERDEHFFVKKFIFVIYICVIFTHIYI